MDFFAIVGFVYIMYFLVYLIWPWFLDCDMNLALYEMFGKPISALKGKVVWITGASSGIGEHLAYVLTDAGCKLILSARRESELERVRANCLQRNPNLKSTDVEVYTLDICNVDMHQKALDHILDKFGKLNILVNNAGRSQRARWEEIDIAVDKEMFDLNVFSQIALSRVVAKYFLKVGQGHFVITSSMAGILPVPFSASYSGSKHALHGYFSCFNVEKLDANVPVTMICPGPIQTGFLMEAFTEKQGEKYAEKVERKSKNKVSPHRCGTLMAIAIANELEEAWIAMPFALQCTYLMTYYPKIGNLILKTLGKRFLQRLRDDRDTLKQED